MSRSRFLVLASRFVFGVRVRGSVSIGGTPDGERRTAAPNRNTNGEGRTQQCERRVPESAVHASPCSVLGSCSRSLRGSLVGGLAHSIHERSGRGDTLAETRVRSKPFRSRTTPRRPATRRGDGGPHAIATDDTPERRFSGLRSRVSERTCLLDPARR